MYVLCNILVTPSSHIIFSYILMCSYIFYPFEILCFASNGMSIDTIYDFGLLSLSSLMLLLLQNIYYEEISICRNYFIEHMF